MRITTHGGSYHADDVIAVAIALMIHPHAEVLRTDDKNIIDLSDIVIDVGQEYDPARLRFDHHQRDFNERRSYDPQSPYASAGLVWRAMGQDVTAHTVNDLLRSKEKVSLPWDLQPNLALVLKRWKEDREEIIDKVAFKIDKDVIRPIDRWDSGIYPREIGLAFSSFISTMSSTDKPFMELIPWIHDFVSRKIQQTFASVVRRELVNLPGEIKEIHPGVYYSKSFHIDSIKWLAEALGIPEHRIKATVGPNDPQRQGNIIVLTKNKQEAPLSAVYAHPSSKALFVFNDISSARPFLEAV